MHQKPRSRPLSGVLNLNKPTGRTSRQVVDQVARLVGKAKVGHAGTLDPLASGVLVVCVGAATRLIEYIQRMPKTYRTVIRLGARSDTLDADGRIEVVVDPPIPDESAVRTALAGQVGAIVQVPPQFSALKVRGRRAYDLARDGRAVELAARTVMVDRLDVLDYSWPRLELEIECGGGTYIRSIARDVGEALGCGGLVEVLTRTRIGPFTREDALDPDALSPENLADALQPPVDAVVRLPQVAITARQVEAVARGQALRDLATATIPEGEVALMGPDGRLVAVAEHQPRTGRIAPRRVLVSP